MTYLLRMTADGPDGARTDLVNLLSDQWAAHDLAREWVKEADDAEGPQRQESVSGPIFRTFRRTDYGERRATVQPLALDDTPKGLA